MDFYTDTLERLVRAGSLRKSQAILIVCGGHADASTLRDAGFTNITVSNVDEGCQFPGVNWSYQDAENLTFPNDSFDWTVVHAGLHHCASPHRALLEMYRVSRVGVLVLESRDSWLMRAAVRLGIVEEYERSAVIAEGGKSGGWRNTAIPNFVYRWTEREVFKVIESFSPSTKHRYSYFKALQVPARLNWARIPLKLVPSALGNRFAFAVKKCGYKEGFP